MPAAPRSRESQGEVSLGDHLLRKTNLGLQKDGFPRGNPREKPPGDFAQKSQRLGASEAGQLFVR